MARGAAIVIGGAVAKGAFAAGALSELTGHLHAEGTPIRAVVGTWLDVLDALQAAGTLTTAAREEVIRGLYPHRDPGTFRRLALVEIRPAAPLPGNPFTGFVRKGLRREYVALGRAAAQAAGAALANASLNPGGVRVTLRAP